MIAAFRAVAVAVILSAALGMTAVAQDRPASTVHPVAAPITLRVQLVISRYQGEKKVSSTPFSLFVTAGDLNRPDEPPSRVRIGAELPVAAAPPSEPKQGTATQGRAVQAFGTNIDCFAKIVDTGRFKVAMTVEDSSPYTEEQRSHIMGSAPAATRSFRISNAVVLKDGQSEQFAMATDKFTGEVVKMDVTLSVVK